MRRNGSEGPLATLFDLTGRVAIVTGGTRGIGRAIAEGFVCAGAKVVVASRKADACAETEAHLTTSWAARRSGCPRTWASSTQLQALVDATVDRFGGIDIVVNNAANALTQPLGEFTPEAWEKSFDVNLRGPVFLVQDALPHLKESPYAAVVNVLSAGAFLASTNVPMYAAAKAGLHAFTRSMAREWAPLGIRVNALAPGTVDTDMVRNNPPEAQASMANGQPACARAAHADEMVGPALLLVSDAGSFITGEVAARRRRPRDALTRPSSPSRHEENHRARPARRIPRPPGADVDALHGVERSQLLRPLVLERAGPHRRGVPRDRPRRVPEPRRDRRVRDDRHARPAGGGAHVRRAGRRSQGPGGRPVHASR